MKHLFQKLPSFFIPNTDLSKQFQFRLLMRKFCNSRFSVWFSSFRGRRFRLLFFHARIVPVFP